MKIWACVSFFLAMTIFNLNVYSGDLVLNSQPSEAEIFVQTLKGGKPIRIGKSPLKMSLNKIKKNISGSDVFSIVVKKLGYKNNQYVMSEVSNSDIEITTILEPSDVVETMKGFDGVLSELFEATRLIRMGMYSDAIKKLESKATDFPLLSTIPELIGTAYFLENKKKEAIAFYDKAVALNPDNLDALRMKKLLADSMGAKTGGRNAASE